MKLDQVKKFVNVAKEANVAELCYENGDEKITVKFASEQLLVHPSAPSVLASIPREELSSEAEISPSPSGAVSAPPSPSQKRGREGVVDVTSPFVGTFYSASSPEANPYVKVGDRISKGQPLCIVEAMKIMNEIESEVSGEIIEICAENETYVEFGQVLFRVRS